MSAYSDWKCGALSDDEYDFCCRREAAMDRALEERDEAREYKGCDNCKYSDQKITETPCDICDGWHSRWEEKV